MATDDANIVVEMNVYCNIFVVSVFVTDEIREDSLSFSSLKYIPIIT